MDIYRKNKTPLEKFIYVLIESRSFAFFVIGILAVVLGLSAWAKRGPGYFAVGSPLASDVIGGVSLTAARILAVIIAAFLIFTLVLIRYRRLARKAKKEEKEAQKRQQEEYLARTAEENKPKQ